MDRFGLSIAGFDPCGGAGLLADVKCFEAHGITGLSVCSALTYQNEKELHGIKWFSFVEIQNQLKPLLELYSIQFVKIGLIKNLSILQGIVDYLLSYNPQIRIIWDPILKSSSGFVFHHAILEKEIENIIPKLFLLTPNIEEAKLIFLNKNESQLRSYSETINILIKGGHGNSDIAVDTLYHSGEITEFIDPRVDSFDKHGTGCVLSASIVSNLILGNDLVESCRAAKSYTRDYIRSSDSLLGKHNYQLSKILSPV